MTQSGLLHDGRSTTSPAETLAAGKATCEQRPASHQPVVRGVKIGDLPMATWCCDWSKARQMMDQLGPGGLSNLRTSLRFETFLHLAASSTLVIEANEAARHLGEMLGISPEGRWLSGQSSGHFLCWFAACLASLHAGNAVAEGEVCIRAAGDRPRRFLVHARPMDGLTDWSAVVICATAINPAAAVDHTTMLATKASPHFTSEALLASISHEVKQPLGSIQNNAAAAKRWLQRDATDLEEARQCVDRVIAQATRSAAIIRGLETLSRSQMTECQRIPVCELVADAVALLRTEELADGANILLNLPHADLAILGDAVQLRQVLLNLMRNAIQAMAAAECDGCVRLMAHEENGYVVIYVRDEGPGIAESEAELIFMPFHGRRAGGSGMGLAICRAVVHAHCGDIQVSNHEAGGAEFRVRFPLYPHSGASIFL